MIDWNVMLNATLETLYMTCVSLIIAVVVGLVLGIIVYLTQPNGLFENKYIYQILNFIINLFRSIPFIILIFLVLPLTLIIVGRMLGASAALPSLVITSAPFYARMCLIAFNEVDKGTIEASVSMGASPLDIILRVLIPESMPALISSVTVMAVTLVGYTAMAGCIGAGGLGHLAYLYGFVRNKMIIMYTATIIVLLIVFIIQTLGDKVVKKIDKR